MCNVVELVSINVVLVSGSGRKRESALIVDVQRWWQHEVIEQLLVKTTTNKRTCEVSMVFLSVNRLIGWTISRMCKHCINLHNSVVSCQSNLVFISNSQFVKFLKVVNFVENHFIEFFKLQFQIVRSG